MDKPTPAQLALARQILQAEAIDGASVGETAASTARKLRERLGRIFSELGSDALLKRALRLASVDFPFLAQADGSENIEALRPALDDADAAQAQEAAGALFGNVIALLVRFVGDDLALHAIGDLWPHATPGAPVAAAHEEHP